MLKPMIQLHVLCGNINFRFSTSNSSSGSLLQFFTLISKMGVAPRSTYPFGRADTTPPSPSTHFRQQNRANSSSKCSCDHLVLRSQMYCKIISRKVCHLRPGFDPRLRQFSLFHVLLQICRFSPFFILVLFTLLSNLKGRRKKRVVTMVKSFQKSSIKKLSLFLKCNIHFVRH